LNDAGKKFVSWFADLSLADRPTVGGKSASLGELTRAGILVPPGFAVTTSAFEAFLSCMDPTGEVRREIGALDPADTAEVAAVGERVRRRIRSASVPEDVAALIRDGYRQLSGRGAACPVAVRSSATSEDSESASFAGLQDTYLWTLGEEQLVARVLDCWASLYNSESITYRLRLGLPEDQLAMAVVVQVMVDAECAGVMFTRSPTTGDKSVIVIEGSWGLGSCIVNGEVTPDRYVVNKVTGEVTNRKVSSKAVRHVPDRSGGGVQEQPVEDERCELPSLDDATIGRLWTIARQVEKHYGCPQDIEWAVSATDGEVYLLQSRPETVWSSKDREPRAKPAAKPYDHLIALMSARKNQP